MVLWRESEEEVTPVRRMLLGLAQRRVPGWSTQDREDLAHDAITKALGQHQLPGRKPLGLRARVTFKDELIDRFRAAGRSREDLSPDPPDPRVEPQALDATLEFAAVCAEINSRLGPEALSLVALRTLGFTYAEIAHMPNWDPARVDRIRKQVWRGQGLLQHLRDVRDTKRKEVS